MKSFGRSHGMLPDRTDRWRWRIATHLFACTIVAMCAASLLLHAPLDHALASPSTSVPGSSLGSVPRSSLGSSPIEELQSARTEALELESRIELWSEEQIAIEERLRAVNLQIFSQQNVLFRAEAELRGARSAVSDRVVRLYKANSDPWMILLASESVHDLYNRVRALSVLTEQDLRTLRDSRIAAAEAAYQAVVLDELKAQELALRTLHAADIANLTAALARQEELIARLDEEARAYIEARRATVAQTRAEWRASSIDISTPIAFVPAIVEPYGDARFLVAEHQPRRYRATGESFSAFCSWYGNQFNGRPTASGQIFNQDDLTCASRTLPFGTRLALTRGDRRIVVVVNDRGPFIPGRDLDLSRAAAAALGFSGLATVHAEFVEVVDVP